MYTYFIYTHIYFDLLCSESIYTYATPNSKNIQFTCCNKIKT